MPPDAPEGTAAVVIESGPATVAAAANAQLAANAAGAAIENAAEVAAAAERAATAETARIAERAAGELSAQQTRIDEVWNATQEQGNLQRQMAERLETLATENQSFRENLSGLSSGMAALLERLTPTPAASPPSEEGDARAAPQAPPSPQPSQRKRRLI